MRPWCLFLHIDYEIYLNKVGPHTRNVLIKSGFYLYLESFIFSAQSEHYFGISIRQDQLRTETQMNEKHFLCGVAKINPTFSVFMVSHYFPVTVFSSVLQMPFREAHGISGKAVFTAESRNVALNQLTVEDLSAIR